jgi:hypothetical protein
MAIIYYYVNDNYRSLMVNRCRNLMGTVNKGCVREQRCWPGHVCEWRWAGHKGDTTTEAKKRLERIYCCMVPDLNGYGKINSCKIKEVNLGSN